MGTGNVTRLSTSVVCGKPDTVYAFAVGHGGKPWRLQWGAEWRPGARGAAPTPVYVALDCESRQELSYAISFHLEGGVRLWSDGVARSVTAAFSWHRGRNPLTQYYRQRTQWWALSLLFDL